MAWSCYDPFIGFQNFTDTLTPTGTNPRLPLGTVVRAVDPNYGAGEFIYLLGVASTVVGSLVGWTGIASSLPTYQTVLVPSTANLAYPVAFAMAVNLAGSYGWYQIAGVCIAATNGTLAAGPAPVYVSATAGQITSTAAAGKQILNAYNCSATGTPAANQALVYINRPFMQGAIT